MRAVGIVQLPLVTHGGRRRDLLGSKRPAAQLAAVHALDAQASGIGGELEGVQAVDQEHVAGLQGVAEGGHWVTCQGSAASITL